MCRPTLDLALSYVPVGYNNSLLTNQGGHWCCLALSHSTLNRAELSNFNAIDSFPLHCTSCSGLSTVVRTATSLDVSRLAALR